LRVRKILCALVGLAFCVSVLAFPAWAEQAGASPQAAILGAINAARRDRGVSPLAGDATLAAVAQACAGGICLRGRRRGPTRRVRP